MKISIRIAYYSCSILLCITLGLLVGCTDDVMNDPLLNEKGVSFRLNVNGNTTKAAPLEGLTVKYILANDNNDIITDIQSNYNSTTSTIVIEPLPKGNYQLFALAYSNSLEQDGFSVDDKLLSTQGTWFSFSDQANPILSNEELYYGKVKFDITSDLPVDRIINLSHILAGLDITKTVESSYLKNSIQDIEINIPNSVGFYSSMAVDGAFNGVLHPLKGVSIKNHNAIFTMPQISKDSIRASFVTTTQNHLGNIYRMVNSASILLKGGVKSNVAIDLSSHPDARNGVLFITKEFYDQENRDLILQDSESKDIYYDNSQRSFNIRKLLQLSRSDKLTLQSRFYSPRPINNVSIWAPSYKYGERVLLAHYDSIPAFCNAKFDFSNIQKEQEFLLESNSKIKLSKEQIDELLTMELQIECKDTYWKKINQIQANWHIQFKSFSGDPDDEDGAPSGDWMGIRPVHIREAIAIWINIGYMITMQSFADHLQTFQGKLYGNGGPDDIIDVKTIIPKINAHSGFNIGLIYAGNGVLGLGGGRTWGVHQPPFLFHYNDPGYCNTIFHELGHCIGYTHNSSMAYGPWAGECANVFYTENINDFPVNSWVYLNSRNNHNIY